MFGNYRLAGQKARMLPHLALQPNNQSCTSCLNPRNFKKYSHIFPFAVVATEVRNLAQRSATAAKEIKALIGNSVDQVDAGQQLVDTAGHTMQEIVDSIQRVAHVIGDISNASREQSAG